MQNIEIVITGASQAPTAQTLQTLIQEITKSQGTIGYITREPKHVDQQNVDPAQATKFQFQYTAYIHANKAGTFHKDPTHAVTVHMFQKTAIIAVGPFQ